MLFLSIVCKPNTHTQRYTTKKFGKVFPNKITQNTHTFTYLLYSLSNLQLFYTVLWQIESVFSSKNCRNNITRWIDRVSLYHCLYKKKIILYLSLLSNSYEWTNQICIPKKKERNFCLLSFLYITIIISGSIFVEAPRASRRRSFYNFFLRHQDAVDDSLTSPSVHRKSNYWQVPKSQLQISIHLSILCDM